MTANTRGLVVIDVDGVILRGQLFLALAWRVGPRAFGRSLWQCARFDMGHIPLDIALRNVFAAFRGMPVTRVWEVYRAMPVVARAAETIAALRCEGWEVVLLSAGVPDFVVRDLVNRLGADGGDGMSLGMNDGYLSGEVEGPLARVEGKLEWVDNLIRSRGIDWRNVVVVGDDRNNLPLMAKAGTSIGFRPMHQVRKSVPCLVDKADLGLILPHIEGSEKHEVRSDPAIRHPLPEALYRKEVRRKLVHGFAAAVPLLGLVSPWAIPCLLVLAAALYFVSEVCRLNGIHLPLMYAITESVVRDRERRDLAVAPLTLVLGVGIVAMAFDRDVAYAAIFIVAFADSVAALVGERWGELPIPYSRGKTIEGSLAFLGVSFVSGLVFVPFAPAVVGALVATVVESANLEEWDNFLVPVSAGIAIQTTITLSVIV
jgi:dolichol kinase/phosphoserine phosphatase